MSKKLSNIFNWNPILRWDSFDDIQELQDQFEKYISESISTIAVNMWEKDNKLILETAIPGMKPSDLNVSVEGKKLIISGENTEEKDKKDEKQKYYMYERSYSSVYRAIDLPQNVDVDKVEANYKNGLLRLEMPKSESQEAKRIEIK